MEASTAFANKRQRIRRDQLKDDLAHALRKHGTALRQRKSVRLRTDPKVAAERIEETRTRRVSGQRRKDGITLSVGTCHADVRGPAPVMKHR